MVHELYRNINILIIFIILLSGISPAFTATEKDNFNLIKIYSKKNNSKGVIKKSNEFFKRYPKSRYIPDIRLILAENEKNPNEAIRKYRIVVSKYRYYTRRDYAQYKICEILSLLSRWRELRTESRKGIKNFPKSSRLTDFKFQFILANINLNQYDEAKKTCVNIIKYNHSYNDLSKALLLLAGINKKISGLSRSYINNLRELALGFTESDSYPATIYLLGKFYHAKGDYNRAYSAFTDLISKFHGSPESIYAEKIIKSLKKYNPVKVKYIPGSKAINETDSIDIYHDVKTDKEKKDASIYYTISIGPFSSYKRSKEIRKLISGFGRITIIKLRNVYVLYVGTHLNSDDALSTKIRLAEEYGINGRIIRVSGNRKKYIYGE